MRILTVLLLAVSALCVVSPAQETCSLTVVAQREVIGGSATMIDVSGSTAIVANSSGLTVVDVSDPLMPVARGSIGLSGARDIAVGAGVAAYVNADGAIRLIDLSNPDQPAAAGLIEGRRWSATDFEEFTAVDFEHGYLYALRNESHHPHWGALIVFSAANPFAPSEISAGYTGFALGKLSVQGDRAFAGGLFVSSNGQNGLPLWATFDVSTPSVPQWCGRIDWWVGYVGGWGDSDEGPLDVASFGRRAIGFTSQTSSGPIGSELSIAGDCVQPTILSHTRGYRSSRFSVAASAQAFFVSDTQPTTRIFALRHDGQPCSSLDGVSFRDMITMPGYLLGAGHGTIDLTVVHVGIPSTEVAWNLPVSGLWASANNWSPAQEPQLATSVIFPREFPGLGGEQPGSYNVQMPTTTPPGVAGLIVEANDVTLSFFENLTTQTFAITENLRLEDGSLHIHAVPGSPVLSTYARLALPASFDTGEGVLSLGLRTSLAGLPAGVLHAGDRVALTGDWPAAPDAALATIEGSVELGAWGAPPADTDHPQLTIDGQGRIEGDLTNRGWLRVRDMGQGSRLIVEGDLANSPTAALEIEVGARAADEPLIVVRGTATIGGALRIRRAPGYVASPGDVVRVLAADGGIDLGNGLDSSGNPVGATIDVPGFAMVEGLLDTGDPQVFWGIDYNQRFACEHVIELVALRVPQVVRRTSGVPGSASGLEALPYIEQQGRNMVLISHGTADSLEPGTVLARTARLMRRLVEARADASRFDIVLLDWREFATNSLIGGAGFDSRGRGFDPFETARFGQQYARSVLAYFAASGLVGGEGGPTKQAFIISGGGRTMHTIGHSSGSYVADGFYRVLADASISPYAGARPGVRHLTLLDTYLPPQYGGVCSFSFGYEGWALGLIGPDATAREQYFNRELVAQTNNSQGCPLAASVTNFDTTDYLHPHQETYASGHNQPVRLYHDSVAWLLSEAEPRLLDPSAGFLDPPTVLWRVGAVFSPVGGGRADGATIADVRAAAIASGDYSDGDVDVVRMIVLPVGAVALDNPSLINPASSAGAGGLTLRTQSPAFAIYDLHSMPLINRLVLHLGSELEGQGLLSVRVNDGVVFAESLSLLRTIDVSEPIIVPLAGAAGEMQIEVRLEPEGPLTAALAIHEIALERATADGVFDELACAPDLNRDDVLDFFDMLMFVGWLADDDLQADWNDDGVLDFFDVIAYVGEFDGGCP